MKKMHASSAHSTKSLTKNSSGHYFKKGPSFENPFGNSLERAALIFCLTMICFLASLFFSKDALARDPMRSSSEGEISAEIPGSHKLNAELFREAARSARDSSQTGATSGAANSAPAFLPFDEGSAPASEGSRNRLVRYTSLLAAKDQRSLWNASSWNEKSPVEYNSCLGAYRKIFSDGIMKMNIAFGYSDNFDRTLDAELYEITVDALTRKCSGRQSVCGFRLVSGTSRKAILEKSIRRPAGLAALNGEEANVKIRITMSYSAANSRDEDNFSGGKITAAQKSATRVSEQVFFGGIEGITKNGVRERCDVCVYYGHARDGGGPDFGPVPYEWRSDDGKIDYSQFHRRRTNYRLMLGAMEKAQDDPPALVAVLACYSHTHFYKKKACVDRSDKNCVAKSLENFKDKTGFILTTDYSWFENFEKTFGTVMDGVLGLKCASAMNSTFSTMKNQIDFKENYRVYGAF